MLGPMKFIRKRVLSLALNFAIAAVASATEPVLELQPLPENAWGTDWAGGCWFHRESDSKGGGGELMFLIRGEEKDSVAVINLDGELVKIPYARTISKSRRFRMGARDTFLYQSKDLSVLVTTIVTEVPKENECAGDCSESSGFAAEIKMKSARAERKYKFSTGACGL